MTSHTVGARRASALAIVLMLGSPSTPALGQVEATRRRVAIPPQVEAVLRAIDDTGQAPRGHLGGGEYRNSGRQGERILPRIDRDGDPIAYRTWDVHPSAPGRGRGAERLVTGSDGSAYYTPDDYRTFAVVRNPARSTHDGPDHARAPAPPPPEPSKGARPPAAPIAKLDPRTAARVDPVVDYVLAHGEPLPGYVGGRDYRNLGLDGGEVLPRADDRGRPIRYREWDVNRKVAGRNRGAERVVTGSDGRAYYTDDHYATFRRIR